MSSSFPWESFSLNINISNYKQKKYYLIFAVADKLIMFFELIMFIANGKEFFQPQLLKQLEEKKIIGCWKGFLFSFSLNDLGRQLKNEIRLTWKIKKKDEDFVLPYLKQFQIVPLKSQSMSFVLTLPFSKFGILH